MTGKKKVVGNTGKGMDGGAVTQDNLTGDKCAPMSRVEFKEFVEEHLQIAKQYLVAHGSHDDLVVIITDTAPTARVTRREDDSAIAKIASDCNASAVINIRAQAFSSDDCPNIIGILGVQGETPFYRYTTLCPYGPDSSGRLGFYESISADDFEYRYFKGAS